MGKIPANIQFEAQSLFKFKLLLSSLKSNSNFKINLRYLIMIAKYLRSKLLTILFSEL